MRYLLILFFATHLTAHAGEDAQSMNVLVKILQACRIVAIENIIFVGYGAMVILPFLVGFKSRQFFPMQAFLIFA